MTVPPSGRQLELVAGDARAVVTEVGATLRRYDAGGAPVVDGFGRDEVAGGGRGQHLLPWPNRVGDGRWTHEGRELQLPLSEVPARNANHGLVRWLSWDVVEASSSTAVLRTAVVPQPGWPVRLEATVVWRLTAEGLACEVTAANAGDRPVPVGYGAHPYLALGDGGVDACELQVPAATRLLVDDRGLPTGSEPVAGTAYDFREPATVGGTVLDTCYGDLSRGPDGRVAVVVRAGGRTTTVWGDGAFRWFQLYSGETLPEAQRRRSLAVEPMTCPPDALRTGTDLEHLEPGQSWSGSWGLAPG